jgi:NADH-quinone oxidoreductase subunit N
LGVALMMAGVFLKNSKSIRTLSVLASIALFAISIYDITIATATTQMHYSNMVGTNIFTAKMMAVISFCNMLYIFLFTKDIAKVGINDAEYFALIFFALSGVGILVCFQSMFMLFLGIEILSIPQYILAGADKRNIKSNEASLKYFLMGAFSTGILLMGITLIYGSTGSFQLDVIGKSLANANDSMALMGILFLIVAMGFKASAAPFHVWTPDVYDGSPTAFTPFMASIAKVAVFAAFVQLFHTSFYQLSGAWKNSIILIICLTLLIGNITAVYQQSVKRMLAYSSIAQAGFMLFAVYGSAASAPKSLLLYGASYMLATMVIFSVITKLKDYTFEGFNGLAKQEPVLAFAAAISLFSLAGIPLTGGFFAKYYMLNSAMQNGMPIWCLIFAVLLAAVSVYYYFKVIRAAYFEESTHSVIAPNAELDGAYKAMLIIACITIIALGLLPGLATSMY